MSVEIHAALVGGALGGGVVLVGVTLESRLNSRRQRRVQVENALQELAMTLPFVVFGLSSARPQDFPLRIGSVWWDREQRSKAALNRIRALAQGRGKMSDVRREAQDLAARLAAAELNADDNKLLSRRDLSKISTSRLWAIVFPQTELQDEKVRRYREHGFQ